MTKLESMYVSQRAEILSRVFLTGRMDVQVFPVPPGFDGGIDQLAKIVADDAQAEKLFGVVLEGTTKNVIDSAASGYLNIWNQHRRKVKRRFPFPVIVLLFSIPLDIGFFAWIAEPLLSDEGEPILRIHEKFTCERTNRRALDLIVKQISNWYDCLYAKLIAEDRDSRDR